MSSRSLAFLACILSATAMLALVPTSVHALPSPSDASVVSGSANFATVSDNMTITQSTSASIINWSSFAINAGESLTFLQPSPSNTTLLRITGTGPTAIFGSLTSFGGLFIVAEAGLVLGGYSSIEAPTIWLSTTNISDVDFLAGNYGILDARSASGTGDGSIIIDTGATITANGGSLSLYGGTIGGGNGMIAPGGAIILNGGGTIAGSGSGSGWYGGTIQIHAIPEPATYSLMLASLVLLGATTRRREQFRH